MVLGGGVIVAVLIVGLAVPLRDHRPQYPVELELGSP
jgi:hypothetical protein